MSRLNGCKCVPVFLSAEKDDICVSTCIVQILEFVQFVANRVTVGQYYLLAKSSSSTLVEFHGCILTCYHPKTYIDIFYIFSFSNLLNQTSTIAAQGVQYRWNFYINFFIDLTYALPL